MKYTVQRGDTIAHVTKEMGTDWRTLKKNNPQAVGRSRQNGNWFIKEGAVLTNQPQADFAASLEKAGARQSVASGPAATPKTTAAGTDGKTAGAGEISHTLKAGETVWELATSKYHVKPEDILKLNNITDARSLQVGQTLRIPDARATLPAESTEVVASWYGSYHQGRPMANGQPFDMYGPTIAHKDIPLGTRVLLENPDTGEHATATVTDRGPYVKGRDVDLSYQLAKRLSLDKQGVGSLLLTVL